MKNCCKLLIIIFFSFFSAEILAQVEVFEDYTPPVDFLYEKEKVGYIYAHTCGWGLGYRQGKNHTKNQYTAWEIDISSMINPKQQRIDPIGNGMELGRAKKYCPGKINQVFMLRGGYNWRFNIAQKPKTKGVQVEWLLSGGGNLTFAKPQYLYIIYYPDQNGSAVEKKLERYDPNNEYQNFYNNVYGAAPMFTGFSKISLHPGIYGKCGFNFEFGKYDEQIMAMETGVMIDAVFPSIDMLKDSKSQSLFFNLYLSFQIGKRYTRH